MIGSTIAGTFQPYPGGQDLISLIRVKEDLDFRAERLVLAASSRSLLSTRPLYSFQI